MTAAREALIEARGVTRILPGIVPVTLGIYLVTRPARPKSASQ